MNVKLISKTYGVNGMSPEHLIAFVARVSNPENQENTSTSGRLIRYLFRKKHWSPFEMADFTVEIKTSRAIAAQILRHRSFSFQEFSTRYSEAYNFEPVQLRKQAETNRQSSTEVIDEQDLNGLVDNIIKQSVSAYKLLINSGVARECARMILPLTTQTTLYMKGSVRSWIHYLQIRTAEDTQLEHRQIALQILEIFKAEFPEIAGVAFTD